jgi:hypothetical protein
MGENMEEYDIKELARIIRQMRKSAENLQEKATGIETVKRNLDKILACINVLELNISDVKDII